MKNPSTQETDRKTRWRARAGSSAGIGEAVVKYVLSAAKPTIPVTRQMV